MMLMASERLFVDTGYFIARFNPRDQYHRAARRLASAADESRHLWTTEAVMLEVCAAFSSPPHRALAMAIWDQFRLERRCRLVAISGPVLERGVDLFRNRPDKAWSLTDCISFVVMSEQGLTHALTSDQHFVQAGFRAMLLEEGNGDSS